MIAFVFLIVKGSLDSVSACLVMRSESQALLTLLAQGGSSDDPQPTLNFTAAQSSKQFKVCFFFLKTRSNE